MVRQKVGWAYKENLWFSEEEAILANKQRDELLHSVSGGVYISAMGCKLYTGTLSPGCQICEKGYWGCNFINAICTRNCFFCPQDRTIKKEPLSHTDGFKFKDPTDHVHFLKSFGIKGVGFSGGEPLLVLDYLLSHITAIRNEFGRSIYQWVYTNGDLLDHGVLKKLRDAGLDEIRFDLSARNYDTSPVVLAKKYLPVVTVEIPAIPEEYELLENLLVEWESIGVDFLNIHQLFATSNNYRSFRQRNYHILHHPPTPVFESEICALKLLQFSHKQELKIPVHYCCSAFKSRFHLRAKRTRLGRIHLKDFEEITNAGYVRSIWIFDTMDKINKLDRELQDRYPVSSLWCLNKEERAIAIHSDLLTYIDWQTATYKINYFSPDIDINDQQEIVVKNLILAHKMAYTTKKLHYITFLAWRKIYLEKEEKKVILREWIKDAVKTGKNKSLSMLKREGDELIHLRGYEEIESGLLEVY